MNTNELSSSPKLPAVVSARLEEFETEFDERRTGTPRLLEVCLSVLLKIDFIVMCFLFQTLSKYTFSFHI